MKRAFARLLPLALASLLAGCSAPSFRNVIYENVSPSARVLSPYGNFSSRNNNYRYVPGSVVSLNVSKSADHLQRSAGVLDADEAACYHRLFTAANLKPLEPRKPDIAVSYDFKLLLQSPFTRQSTVDSFLKETELSAIPDGVFALIRNVDYSITNIKIYEATPEQLKVAFDAIAADKFCSQQILTRPSVTVRRIYVGNVEARVRWDAGYNASLGPAMSTVQQSLRSYTGGRRVVFAAETN